MSYQLIIAEKPSVARSIAGVIGADKKQDGYMEGNGYLVSWCIGHLVSLADAGTYDERFKKWRYDDLPILPQEWQYIIPDDKKKQFDTLRSLMERPDVTGLVCATDAGREGELIFRFVYQMAGCKKPFQRLWISSMEDAAIKDGFAHLKPGTDYDNLYQSALCRAQADWLVGINATRLFLHPLPQDPDRGPCPDADPEKCWLTGRPRSAAFRKRNTTLFRSRRAAWRRPVNAWETQTTPRP